MRSRGQAVGGGFVTWAIRGGSARRQLNKHADVSLAGLTAGDAARLITAVLVLGILTGCSGSDEDGSSANGPTVVANLAENEARRSAAIYSTWQQIMSVLLVTLRSPDDWSQNDGAVLGCTGGGTVSVTFFPGTSTIDDRVTYTYEDCIEAIGEIDGTFDGQLRDDERDTRGFWRPSWDAELVIAGTRFQLDGGDTRVDTNSVSGDYAIDARITPFSSLTAPTGESFGLATGANTNTLTFSLDVSASEGQFTEASLDFASASGPDMRMNAVGSTPVSVSDGVGAISLGVPTSGEFIFRRSITPDQPDIVADAANNSGLVDFEVRAAGSFASDAEQFTWDELLANPQFDSSGLRGE
ncbi:MAG: hypothetical protein CMH65_09825 [Nevskiales bacterium]|nr:hypothetical protein [Nevskiales bacterium]